MSTKDRVGVGAQYVSSEGVTMVCLVQLASEWLQEKKGKVMAQRRNRRRRAILLGMRDKLRHAFFVLIVTL
jgi:hypothetical protein